MIKKWYAGINNWQRIFMFAVSGILVLVEGIGLVPLVPLIYLELGRRGDKSPPEVD